MEALLSAKAAVLQGLAIPAFGLELVERVRRQTAGLVRLGLGSIYPALRALEQQGLVRSRPGFQPMSAGRPRRYYELTPRGVATAMAQRQALAAFFRPRPAGSAAEDVGLMRERILRCARLSEFVLTLRRQTIQAAGKASL
jgi:PadR family transcriptional regulator